MIFMDFLLTTTWLPYLYSFPFELIFSSVHNIAFFFLLQFSRHLFYVVYKAFLLLIEDELLLLTSIFYLRIYSQGRTNTHKTITSHIKCSHKSGNHKKKFPPAQICFISWINFFSSHLQLPSNVCNRILSSIKRWEEKSFFCNFDSNLSHSRTCLIFRSGISNKQEALSK